MKMDIDYLTELVMQKFTDTNVYIEMSREDLKKIIHKHLTGFYHRKVSIGNIQLNIRKLKGEEISETLYQEALSDAQSTTIRQAYAIGATSNKDLKDLREMAKL